MGNKSGEILKIGLYCGSWAPNIENAFINLGVKATLQRAFPDSKIFHIGCSSHWFFNYSARKNGLEQLIGNSFEIGEVADLDIIVLAGMVMCKEFVENNGITFIKAAKRGVPVMFLGAGAAYYTEDEANCFSTFLNNLSSYAVITRDNNTFNLFNGKISNLYSGIDSAFFLPDYYDPPKILLPPFDVVNFDRIDNWPHISHNVDHIIYTHHETWRIINKNFLNKPNTLVSDVSEDYMTVYSQANETHSDRVHACVATLAYGNKARLYSNTPRKDLFTKLKAERITEQVISLDIDLLANLKLEQIYLARKLISELVISG